MSGSTIWDLVLSRIEDQVGRHSFSTWFKPTSLLTDDGKSLSIRVPNTLFVEWLPKHYSVVLAEAMRDAGRADSAIVFVPDLNPQPARRRAGPGPDASKTTAAAPRAALSRPNQRLARPMAPQT